MIPVLKQKDQVYYSSSRARAVYREQKVTVEPPPALKLEHNETQSSATVVTTVFGDWSL